MPADPMRIPPLMSGGRSGGSNRNSKQPSSETAPTRLPVPPHQPLASATRAPPGNLNLSNKPTRVLPDNNTPVAVDPSTLAAASAIPVQVAQHSRPPSLRPAEPPSSRQLDPSAFNTLCRKVVQQVHLTSLRCMFDDVKLADSRGNISDQEYSHLLDFFYSFVPMCVRAPENDPVIARPFELRTYEKILGEMWEERAKKTGPHNRHQWYSRPSNKWIRTTKAIM